MTNNKLVQSSSIVNTMREASPYMRAHRDEVFVVYVGGEALHEPGLPGLVQDLVLLRGLGVKLVVVHGARAQIDAKTAGLDIKQTFVGNLRVTGEATLVCVKEAVAAVRLELEARLSQCALDAPRRGSRLTVAGGNFVIARPAGIVDGVDLHFTGEVRRIDRTPIEQRLKHDELVLISPLGYSPTGEVFNLNALDLACAVACEIGASKLILMIEPPGIVDQNGATVRQLTVGDARELNACDPVSDRFLECAVRACQFGVGRVHLVNRGIDGALIDELYTRDGIGTLVSNTPFDQMRQATIEEVGGILALITPLEREGSLVKRSREKLEIEINHFSVLVREGIVVACGALYPLGNALGEIACIAVHLDYRCDGFGNLVLASLERRATEAGLERLFVLTTQAVHWFLENAYVRTDMAELPIERQTMYNFQRNSTVLSKRI